MGKRSRREKGKRHQERQEALKKTALIRFLEATRLFGVFLNPNKKRSKIKLFLIQIMLILSSAVGMYLSIIIFMEPEIIIFGILLVGIFIITIVRAILALYAYLIKGYQGI
jgi:hypothetical protein